MPKKRKPSTKMKAKGMICTKPDCGNAVHCKGLCKSHYGYLMRERRNEELGLLTVTYEKRGRFCKLDGCDDRTIAKNLCRKHYYQERARILQKAVPCRREGCIENAVPTSFLCLEHRRDLDKAAREAMAAEAKIKRDELARIYPDDPRFVIEPLVPHRRVSFIKFGNDITAVETNRLELMVPVIDRILSNKGYVVARMGYKWNAEGNVHHVVNNQHVVERFTIQNV